ncbi:hypothetical protein FRC03_006782 [Tulasnella sp. 419]|nr:hypothetical protein FRC03_006782 [Tulasnella sp. 419]
MPVIFNSFVLLQSCLLKNFERADSVVYTATVYSVDNCSSYRAIIHKRWTPTTVLLSPSSVAQVSGIMTHNHSNHDIVSTVGSAPHVIINANYGNILPASMGRVLEADNIVNITGTVHNLYHDLKRCLTLEVYKSYNRCWYISVDMSDISEDAFREIERGMVIHAAAKFSRMDKTTDGSSDLLIFEPIVYQEISAWTVSHPHCPAPVQLDQPAPPKPHCSPQARDLIVSNELDSSPIAEVPSASRGFKAQRHVDAEMDELTTPLTKRTNRTSTGKANASSSRTKRKHEADGNEDSSSKRAIRRR